MSGFNINKEHIRQRQADRSGDVRVKDDASMRQKDTSSHLRNPEEAISTAESRRRTYSDFYDRVPSENPYSRGEAVQDPSVWQTGRRGISHTTRPEVTGGNSAAQSTTGSYMAESPYELPQGARTGSIRPTELSGSARQASDGAPTEIAHEKPGASLHEKDTGKNLRKEGTIKGSGKARSAYEELSGISNKGSRTAKPVSAKTSPGILYKKEGKSQKVKTAAEKQAEANTKSGYEKLSGKKLGEKGNIRVGQHQTDIKKRKADTKKTDAAKKQTKTNAGKTAGESRLKTLRGSDKIKTSGAKVDQMQIAIGRRQAAAIRLKSVVTDFGSRVTSGISKISSGVQSLFGGMSQAMTSVIAMGTAGVIAVMSLGGAGTLIEKDDTAGPYDTTNTFISKETCPNAYETFTTLVSLGLTETASAAIVGNFFQECGGAGSHDLNPAASSPHDYGLAQFTPPGPYFEWADGRGYERSSILVQCTYIVEQLRAGQHWWSGSRSESALLQAGLMSKAYTTQEFFACNDLREATSAFLAYYEECIRGVEDNYYDAIEGIVMTRAMRANWEFNNRFNCAAAVYNAFGSGSGGGSGLRWRMLGTSMEKDGSNASLEAEVNFTTYNSTGGVKVVLHGVNKNTGEANAYGFDIICSPNVNTHDHCYLYAEGIWGAAATPGSTGKNYQTIYEHAGNLAGKWNRIRVAWWQDGTVKALLNDKVIFTDKCDMIPQLFGIEATAISNGHIINAQFRNVRAKYDYNGHKGVTGSWTTKGFYGLKSTLTKSGKVRNDNTAFSTNGMPTYCVSATLGGTVSGAGGYNWDTSMSANGGTGVPISSYLTIRPNDGTVYGSGGGSYSVPPEALSDERFMNMLTEAQKYIGVPYAWGGETPSGFDCSGYVSWVVNHCGNGWNYGRLTAEGLRQQCAYVSPEDARPGDLIFLKGTYGTDGASHLGIYLGNGLALHCGRSTNGVNYINTTGSYWQSHFYQYGRLP